MAGNLDIGVWKTCGYWQGRSGEEIVCPGNGYCNTANQYSAVACCDDAYIEPAYSPYACDFYTDCLDSTSAKSVSLQSLTSGGHLGTLVCSDSKSPWCFQYAFTDIGYGMWECVPYGPRRTELAAITTNESSSMEEIMDVITSTSSTTSKTSSRGVSSPSSTSSSTVFVLVTSKVTLTTQGSIVTSDLVSSTSTSATNEILSASSGDADRPVSKNTVIGAALGGIAGLAALALAGLLLWRRKMQQKAVETASAKSSFRVLSNAVRKGDRPEIAVDRSLAEFFTTPAATGAVEASSDPPRSVSPFVPDRREPTYLPAAKAVEAPSGPGRIVSPLADKQKDSAYEPYRPLHGSNGTPSIDSFRSRAEHLSELSSSYQPSLSGHQPYHYQSYASFGNLTPVAEVHGTSAPNSCPSTPTVVRNVNGSRFSELESVPVMSTQSGPVPEWRSELS